MNMNEKIMIGNIPALLWGKPSDRVYLHVHGKMSRKEYAEHFASVAEEKGFQTLSFDLPEHGERSGSGERCDVWNGMRDLNAAADYAFARFKEVSLFACSIGAYFALNALADRKLRKCLFQSPIVDMEWLVRHMMLWSGVTERQLEAEGEIETPIDTLRFDYYRYILSHPVRSWPHPTSVLYAGQDKLQPRASIDSFCARFGANLTVSEQSEHPFMAESDFPIVDEWLRTHL